MFSSVQFSYSVVPDSLQSHGLQYSRPPCPSPTPEFSQTHVHWVSDTSNHLILCHPLILLPSIFPGIRVFSSESVLHIRWPKYWSFTFSMNMLNMLHLPMNIQDWSLLGWTGWLSLQSKGLSRVFSNTTVQKHQPFGWWSSSHFHTWLLEKP